jgi:hypothetical protein
MIDNSHELTIGELDAVNGGELTGLLGNFGSVMGMIGQVMQGLQTKDLQQAINDLGVRGQG